MINGEARTVCEMCTNPKPHATRPVQAASASSSSGKWNCGTCTLANNASATLCKACRSPKPRGKTAVKKKPTRPTATSSSTRTPAVSSSDVTFLREMGFSEKQARGALKKNSNKEAALDWLLNQPAPSSTSTTPTSTTTQKKKKKKNPVAEAKKESARQPAKTKLQKPVETAAEAKNRVAREEERAALLKQDEERLQQLQRQQRQEELAIRKAGVAANKKAKQAAKAEKARQAAEKQLQRAQLEQTEASRRKTKRQAEEKGITSAAHALTTIKDNYDPARVAQTFGLLRKLVSNVVQHPTDSKYCKVKLSHPKVQKNVVRPLGGVAFLRFLGFQEQEDVENNAKLKARDPYAVADTRCLIVTQPDMVRFNKGLALLDKHIDKQTTLIAKSLSNIDFKGNDAGMELLYFALLDLHEVLSNVIAFPTEKNFCQIDMVDEAYVYRMRKVPQVIRILTDLGFQPNEHKNVNGESEFLVVDKPVVTKFEAGLVELTAAITRLRLVTPIAKAVRKLLKNNSFATVAYIHEKLSAALSKVMADPHDKRFHKFRTDKFFKKTGPIDGGVSFLAKFGFVIDPKAQTATLPYPDGVKGGWLQLRSALFNQCMDAARAAPST